jgi:hypothetical protein
MNPIASRHLEKALKYEQNGRTADAIEQYQRAIKAAPLWSFPWFNLGLLHKHQHRWQDSFKCNQKAAELDPKDDAAWWNLGIAATAIGDWAEARRAWKQYGIELPPGEGPIEMQLGLTPIRINPEDQPEVVWCRRIDPARAIIENIPLAESRHRYGDLLLHDGQPVGYRLRDGRQVPAFNELQLLESSEFGTYEATVDGAGDEEFDMLNELARELRMAAEDWSTGIRSLCHACSEGRPFDEAHPEEHCHGQLDDRRVAIAARSEAQAQSLLDQWRGKHPHLEIIEMECVLAPAFVN